MGLNAWRTVCSPGEEAGIPQPFALPGKEASGGFSLGLSQGDKHTSLIPEATFESCGDKQMSTERWTTPDFQARRLLAQPEQKQPVSITEYM